MPGERAIYFDESGDLGFATGSSRHFVITFLSVPGGKALTRMVRKVRREYDIPVGTEMKAFNATDPYRDRLLSMVSRLDNLDIYYIVAKKERVEERLREKTNILYNYIAGCLLVPFCKRFDRVMIFADARILKVPGGLGFNDYLFLKLRYDEHSDVKLEISHILSQNSYGIQAADFVSRAIFRRYEVNDWSDYNIIKPKIVYERHLYF